MKFWKWISRFKTRKDRPDPVLPRLWHGPSTALPEDFKIPAADLPTYGIDPARVRKFLQFRNLEEWLHKEVVTSYDEIQKDPSKVLTVDEVLASLASPRRQHRILASSLSAADAFKRSGSVATDAESWASHERRQDRLFGVWSSFDHAFVHPDFQFTDGRVHPRLPELLGVLRGRAGFDPASSDRGGWARAYWLYQPDARLSESSLAAGRLDLSDVVAASEYLSSLNGAGRSPAEMFASYPEAVIALAEALPATDAAKSRDLNL